MSLPADLMRSLGPRLLTLDLAIFDLPRTTGEALAAIAAPPLVRLTLVIMRTAAEHPEAVGEALIAHASIVAELFATPGGREGFALVLRYSVIVGELDPAPLSERLKRALDPELGEAVMKTFKTTAEKLREEGQRTLMERLLLKRFGPLDDEVRARIGKATAEQLDQWVERLFDAKSLGDVFGA